MRMPIYLTEVEYRQFKNHDEEQVAVGLRYIVVYASFKRACHFLAAVMCAMTCCWCHAATPTVTGSADTVVGLWYNPSPGNLPNVAWSLAGSAATSIRLATWQLSDGTLASALCMAATNGVNVQVALNLTGGSGTTQHAIARQLTASGGTVWSCNFPNHIANNFMSADGDYTLQGNYYFSPTATQIGSYLIAISGTNAATISNNTFNTLIATGTVTTAFIPAPREPAAEKITAWRTEILHPDLLRAMVRAGQRARIFPRRQPFDVFHAQPSPFLLSERGAISARQAMIFSRPRLTRRRDVSFLARVFRR